MKKRIVIDSGPLVALFNKGDIHCADALEFLENNSSPLYTTLAVITEVVYVLDFSIKAQTDFLEWIFKGGLTILNLVQNDFKRLKYLMEKYKDLPMDFADGTVIVACENLKTQCIATIDKDFEIYRYQDNKKFIHVF